MRQVPGGAGLLVVVVALLLAACGGGPEREWRDLELTLPDGWVVFEDEPSRFSVSDGRPADEGSEGARGDREVAAFLTHEPGARPDAWRAFVEEVDGTLESDRAVEVGGVPATELVFSHASNGVPIREMVVVVPSRDLVMLLQPIVMKDQTDGPAVFDAHRDEFAELVSSVRFGAPVDAADR